MATTNFAKMTDHELKTWSMSWWKNQRNKAFLTRLLGKTADSPVQRITELTKTKKGTKAIITLIPDALGDGIAGDRTLKGNEEALRSFDQVIQIDQLRKAHSNEGRMADQRTLINFRKTARDVLAQWNADRTDQMFFLTMAGVSYAMRNDGAPRVGSDLPYLEYAKDVTPPTANRHFRWNSVTGDLSAGNTAAVVAGDTPSYKMLIKAKVMAQNLMIKPVRGELGTEMFHVFMTPDGIGHLKLDDDFLKAWREAMPRSPNSPIFKGFDTIYLDGLAIHTHRYTYNTRGAASGSKWGAAGAVNGQRVCILGAQGLGYADIGAPYWDEETDDYNNRQGIAIGKIQGFKKPVFYSDVTQTEEDFSVLCIDTAI